jgi:hypothetical protein
MSAGIGQALEVLWRTLAAGESNPLKSFSWESRPRLWTALLVTDDPSPTANHTAVSSSLRRRQNRLPCQTSPETIPVMASHLILFHENRELDLDQILSVAPARAPAVEFALGWVFMDVRLRGVPKPERPKAFEALQQLVEHAQADAERDAPAT